MLSERLGETFRSSVVGFVSMSSGTKQAQPGNGVLILTDSAKFLGRTMVCCCKDIIGFNKKLKLSKLPLLFVPGWLIAPFLHVFTFQSCCDICTNKVQIWLK